MLFHRAFGGCSVLWLFLFAFLCQLCPVHCYLLPPIQSFFSLGMEWNGICFSGQRPSTGTGKVIQRLRREKKKKTEKKHPTKLVKAATCCLLSPLTTTTGWILRGSSLLELWIIETPQQMTLVSSMAEHHNQSSKY